MSYGLGHRIVNVWHQLCDKRWLGNVSYFGRKRFLITRGWRLDLGMVKEREGEGGKEKGEERGRRRGKGKERERKFKFKFKFNYTLFHLLQF